MILLAEPDPAIRDICVEVLRDAGYTVLPATATGDLRRMIATHAVTLVLLDVGSWDPQTLEQSRALAALPTVPLVIWTTTEEHLLAEYAQWGAVAAILKPFELDALLALVARWAGPPEAVATL